MRVSISKKKEKLKEKEIGIELEKSRERKRENKFSKKEKNRDEKYMRSAIVALLNHILITVVLILFFIKGRSKRQHQ